MFEIFKFSGLYYIQRSKVALPQFRVPNNPLHPIAFQTQRGHLQTKQLIHLHLGNKLFNDLFKKTDA